MRLSIYSTKGLIIIQTISITELTLKYHDIYYIFIGNKGGFLEKLKLRVCVDAHSHSIHAHSRNRLSQYFHFQRWKHQFISTTPTITSGINY